MLYDYLMRNFLFSLWENLIYILVGILVLNIIVLDIYVFAFRPKSIVQNIELGNSSSPSSPSTPATPSSTPPPVAQTVQDTCPNACLAAIKTATATTPTPKVTLTPTNTPAPAQSTSSGGAQEFFIPFGSASGASQGTYTTLGALQSYVNISQYSGVQSVTFEVSMTIPNGNQIASAQLYNATDGYPIPNSQVTMSGGTPQLLISPNITLPAGNKLYQVQINTQLNSSINIDQARLHITTN